MEIMASADCWCGGIDVLVASIAKPLAGSARSVAKSFGRYDGMVAKYIG
jgi:hypothetical protein